MKGDDETLSKLSIVDYSLQRGNDTLTMKKINDPSQNHHDGLNTHQEEKANSVTQHLT